MAQIDPELYEAICQAEQAARKAHDLSFYSAPSKPWLRMALGRAQSMLMTQVVKYAETKR